MPLYLSDRDAVSEAAGLSSALIVPCDMCPAVSLAVKEDKPFMQLFRSVTTSAPLGRYVQSLQVRLREKGVSTKVFKSRFYHHWFVCMWTSGRRKKLRRDAKQFDAVIVLGCDTATETIRDAIQPSDCRIIEGMQVTGLMNAKLSIELPCNISFKDCKIIPMTPNSEASTSLPDSVIGLKKYRFSGR